MSHISDTKAFQGDEKTREDIGQATPESRAKIGGLGFGVLEEERVYFDKMPCEIVLPHDEGSKNGAYLVFGRDRVGGSHPDAQAEGPKQYGDQFMHTGTAMIDLVVGRHACLFEPGKPPRSEVEVTDEEGNKKLVPNRVNPSFVNDAARIYISQKTCLDEALELTPGGVGNPEGKSGIALKADGIRIVAREGIKIIADCDKNNSAGLKNTAKGGINLIFGNTTEGPDYELHPMVKGNNLTAAMSDMNDMIGSLSSMIADLQVILLELTGDYASHMHVGNVGGPTPGLAPSVIPAGVKALISMVQNFSTKTIAFQTKHALWKTNYIMPLGGKYICSSWNYAN